MTYKDWLKRPDLIEELSQILGSETFQKALSVLIEDGLPKSTLRTDSPNFVEANALLNAKREGYYDFLRVLRALAVQKTLPPEINTDPWKHAGSELEA
jgi:hypothetical protein